VKRALSLGIVSSVLCLSVVAHAEEPFTASKATVGVGVGYGVYTGDEMGADFNPYGIGFGVRGGYTLPANVYLGGLFEYYLGATEEVEGVGEFSANIYQIMFEGGYDLGLGPTAVIRPVLGIGYSTVKAESCVEEQTIPGLGTFGGGCQDTGDSKLGIAPGAVALLDFGSVFGMGAVRYNHIFVEDGNADAILLTVGAGMKF
jgi:hypothetical protein